MNLRTDEAVFADDGRGGRATMDNPLVSGRS
jgi:hypothetical protein